jgi:YhgE/Pip-like protein
MERMLDFNGIDKISKHTLSDVLGTTNTIVEPFIPWLNEYCQRYEINTPLRLAAFLAQIGHESGRFRYVEEIAKGTAYEGRKDLGNIAEIMKHDFKSAFSNPIVTIVLIAIIILPSLYALLNIQACWDPYGNTENVEFAIANLDKGASIQDTPLNIGDELVKDLRNNDKFKWTFVTEDELRDGVYSGKYYAGMVIPKNLSKNVVSITTDNPKQAKLEYVVNVKSNPVATKLTDTGANTVYSTLNAKIVEFINLAAYGKL